MQNSGKTERVIFKTERHVF